MLWRYASWSGLVEQAIRQLQVDPNTAADTGVTLRLVICACRNFARLRIEGTSGWVHTAGHNRCLFVRFARLCSAEGEGLYRPIMVVTCAPLFAVALLTRPAARLTAPCVKQISFGFC